MSSQQKLALDGVRVVEYGSFITAPYCGKLSANLGVEVMKVVELGRNDITRRRTFL